MFDRPKQPSQPPGGQSSFDRPEQPSQPPGAQPRSMFDRVPGHTPLPRPPLGPVSSGAITLERPPRAQTPVPQTFPRGPVPSGARTIPTLPQQASTLLGVGESAILHEQAIADAARSTRIDAARGGGAGNLLLAVLVLIAAGGAAAVVYFALPYLT
jgi:hypothetical protein